MDILNVILQLYMLTFLLGAAHHLMICIGLRKVMVLALVLNNPHEYEYSC